VDATPEDRPRNRTLRSVSVALLWVAAFVVFLWIQRRLSTNSNHPLWGDTGLGGAADAIQMDMRLSGLRFVGASLAMATLIVGAGRRVLFALPVLFTLFLPALLGGVFDCWAWDQAKTPHGLGAAWWYTSAGAGCVDRFQAGWMGLTIDLGLVVVPAVALAMTVPKRIRTSEVSPAAKLVAAVCCAIVIGLAMSVRELAVPGYDWTVWLSFHIPLVTYGALLGVRRSPWSLALVVVPIALFPLHVFRSVVPLEVDPIGTLYVVSITLLGAAWSPLTVGIERGRTALGRVSAGRRPAVPVGS
jgi:hypothetical protein